MLEASGKMQLKILRINGDPFQQMFFQGQHENVEYLNFWAKSGKNIGNFSSYLILEDTLLIQNNILNI
jgi:hypothetical protein